MTTKPNNTKKIDLNKNLKTNSKIDTKTKILALLEAGYHEKEIIQELKIKAPAIKKIQKEWDEKQNSQHIADLAAKNEVALLADSSILTDSIQCLILSDKEKELLMDQVTDLTEGLKGLSILSSTLQVAAIKITQGIINGLKTDTTPQEIYQLSNALAKLNDTFFNPNNTSINILNQDGGETNVHGGAFSKYMKD